MRDDYSKLFELINFINDLHANRLYGLSMQQIMERYEWNRKKTERMLNKVKEVFHESFRSDYADDGSHRKRYRLVGTDMNKMPVSFINEDDIASLRNGAEILKNNVALSNTIKSIAEKLEKINKRASANAEYIIGSTGTIAVPGPRIVTNKKIFDQLQNAILSYNQVKIKYHGKTSTMCPLGVLYGVRNNYLVAAHIRHMNNPVKYILNEIESVTILPTTFDADNFDIQQYVERSFGVFTENDTGFDVVWQVVDKNAVEDARRYIFHPSQEMIDNPDGTLTIKFHACGLREMAWHLFTWGGAIVPVAPAELVETYQECIEKARKSVKK